MAKYTFMDYLPVIGIYRGIREARRLYNYQKSNVSPFVRNLNQIRTANLYVSGIGRDFVLFLGIISLLEGNNSIAGMDAGLYVMNSINFFACRNNIGREIKREGLDNVLCKL